MNSFKAELHVHTVLSPCADVEMIPPLIIQAALERGINLLAITDHNSTANISAVQEASRNTNITVLPGMELQTREEIHLLCIFDSLKQSGTFQQLIDPLLPDIKNDPEHFGEQFIIDPTGEYVASESRLLLNSVNIDLDEAVLEVHKLGGLAIPAHIDRKAYGLLNMLGFFPPELKFDAVELSRFTTMDMIKVQYPDVMNFPIIQSGDVHRLEEFLGICQFEMEIPDLSNIRNALLGNDSYSFHLGKMY